MADFTSIRIEDEEPGRVRISGSVAAPSVLAEALDQRQQRLKAIGMLVYSWPQALHKAIAADWIARERAGKPGLAFEKIYPGYFGVNGCGGWRRPRSKWPDDSLVQHSMLTAWNAVASTFGDLRRRGVP